MFSASSIYWLKMNRAVQLGLAVFFAVVLIPILGARNVFYLEVIFQIAVFSALALGLNIVVGFSGLLNFGYMAFYAVGAYLWAFFGSQQPNLLHSTVTTKALNTPFFMAPDWFYLFVFLGVIVAAILGLILGLPVLRVRGDYLAIITLAFGEIVRQLANNLDKPLNFTNGPQGITPIQRPTMPEGVLHFFNSVVRPLVGHRVTDNQAYNILFYFIALMVVVAVIVITYRLDDSKVGRAWTAIREDELSAGAMGINANKLKLGAFAVGRLVRRGHGRAVRRQPHLRQSRDLHLPAVGGRAHHGHPGRDRQHHRRDRRRHRGHPAEHPGAAELLPLPVAAAPERGVRSSASTGRTSPTSWTRPSTSA